MGVHSAIRLLLLLLSRISSAWASALARLIRYCMPKQWLLMRCVCVCVCAETFWQRTKRYIFQKRSKKKVGYTVSMAHSIIASSRTLLHFISIFLFIRVNFNDRLLVHWYGQKLLFFPPRIHRKYMNFSWHLIVQWAAHRAQSTHSSLVGVILVTFSKTTFLDTFFI